MKVIRNSACLYVLATFSGNRIVILVQNSTWVELYASSTVGLDFFASFFQPILQVHYKLVFSVPFDDLASVFNWMWFNGQFAC